MMAWESGDTWIAIAVMAVFWGALSTFLVLLFRRFPADDAGESSHAEQVLAHRFANGEIDEEEFRARRALLRS